MENLHRLTSDALVDILSKQTADYLQMQSEGGSVDEYQRCKLFLRAVQKELAQRNKNKVGDLDQSVGTLSDNEPY